MDGFISRFIHNKDDSSAKARRRMIAMTSIVGIVINLVFAVLKLFIGIISNSVATSSDAVNNFADLVGIRLSQKPQWTFLHRFLP